LALARQVQSRQQRQRQDEGGAGDTKGHSHDDPVVTAGGGDPFAGAGDGVTPPTQSPDGLAAFVSEGVIDEEGDTASEVQSGEDEEGEAIGEILGFPGGTLEEVVVGVHAVAFGVVRGRLRVGGMSDAEQGVLTQAHDPGKQESARGGGRRLGKSGGETIDTRLKRGYHVPHGRASDLVSL
jgi:hypothetical protein